jgi:preprotein translocase subunit SecG
MLYSVLLVLLVLDSLVLIAAVLLQAGQGGGMAASFGGVSSSASSFLGTRQTGNLLTKASWWCGGLFLGLAFLLSLASTRSRAPKSILDQTFVPTPVTAPANPANQAAPSGNATVPLTPAPTNVAPATKAPPTSEKKAPAPATPANKKP